MLTYQELMLQFGELVGRRPLILPVPVLTPQLSSYWLNLVTAVPTNIARALIAGLEHDVLADDTAIRALIPIPLKTYRDAARAALAAERAGVPGPRWTEGSMVYRQNRPDFAFYAKQMSGNAVSPAPAEALWREVASIGGENGYYYLDALWKARGCVDELTGGTEERTRIVATAYFHPAGAPGLAYWYALAPAHAVIFNGLAKAIAERAERGVAPVEHP